MTERMDVGALGPGHDSDDVDQWDDALDAAQSGADSPQPEPAGPRVWNATDLAPAKRVEWLAQRRIPRAAVTYMVGPEGIGKSLFTVWLTAAVTTGRPCPQFGIPERAPGIVVLVLTEDDWATIARPRLELAGADLANVRVLCEEQDGSGAPTFPAYMHLFDKLVADLVIVDAWADTLPSKLNVKDPQQARQALHPWKELATRSGAAVLLSGHLNRDTGGNVRNAYGLTGELRKKARMTLLAQPDDETGDMIVGPEKSNLTRPVKASRFHIHSVQVYPATDDSDGTVPVLRWVADADQSAREYFSEAAEGADRADRTEAEEWLVDYLNAQGEVKRVDVIAAAVKARIASDSTIKRAAKRIGVHSETRGFPREAYWSLPSQSGQSGHQSGQSGHQSGQSGHHVPVHDPTDLTVSDLHVCGDPTAEPSPSRVTPSQSGHAEIDGSDSDPTGVWRVSGQPIGGGAQ